MQTETVEVGRFERMLTLQLNEAELDDAKNRAARRLSRELKIKGFRPGKAPRPVIERVVGAQRLRGEAIDEALPEMVGKAIVAEELEPVTTPRVDAVRDLDDGGVEVEVLITLWPTVDELPDYDDRRIIVDVGDVEPEEVEEQIDRFRSQFAELEEVNRAGDIGDFMHVNITALRDGKEIEEASASDLTYEIGSRSFIPGLDEMLVGAAAGDIREGPASLPAGFGEHAGEEVTLRVLVKGVRGKKLPEVTDEWVGDVSEFDTVAELRRALTDELSAMKRASARETFANELVERLLADLELELPEALVQAEVEASVHNLYHSLESEGLELANYLQITGQSEAELAEELRRRADRVLKTRILLEGIGRAEALEVEEEEVAQAVDSIADSSGRSVEEVRSALRAGGQEEALAGDILRRKVFDLLVRKATAVDAEGNTVDLRPPVDEDDVDDEEDRADDTRDGTVEAT